jgi:hypothetical protein
MIFHQQLREFIKAHLDLGALTEEDLEELETALSAEESEQSIAVVLALDRRSYTSPMSCVPWRYLTQCCSNLQSAFPGL